MLPHLRLRSLLERREWTIETAPARWTHIEDRFLSTMWDLDQAGTEQSDHANRQNFFLELAASILKNGSGKELRVRGAAPGLIFPTHNFGISYPVKGPFEILVQVKTAGTPKGRPGITGLSKWIKEAIFKTIDLKAEWARNAGQGEGPTSDLVTWLRQSKPRSFLFLVVRVVDDGDFEKILLLADAANQMMNGVGLLAYQTNPLGNGYQVCQIPHHLELDRVLTRVCAALRVLP